MKRGETAADDGGRKGGTAAQRGKIAVDDREKEKTEKAASDGEGNSATGHCMQYIKKVFVCEVHISIFQRFRHTL